MLNLHFKVEISINCNWAIKYYSEIRFRSTVNAAMFKKNIKLQF